MVWVIMFIYAFDNSELFYLYLLAVSGVATVFCWASICISHYQFRKRLYAEGLTVKHLKFYAPFFPLANVLGLLILALTLLLTAYNSDLRLSLYVGIPAFLVPCLLFWIIRHSAGYQVKKEINFLEVLAEIKSDEYLKSSS